MSIIEKQFQSIRTLLTRVATPGTYIPEVDGLRFVAITLVVVLHIFLFIAVTYRQRFSVDPIQLPVFKTVQTFEKGVQLFFAISGFILSIPFARGYISRNPIPTIGNYFRRRLLRLEPPFAISMLFIAVLLVAFKHLSPIETLKHLLATISYCHVMIFGVNSSISYLTWSLEIEAQFYLLMPLLARVYQIERQFVRLALLVVTALLFICFQHFVVPTFTAETQIRIWYSLVAQFQYFLAGMLLADLYVNRHASFGEKQRLWDFISLLGWPALLLLWHFPTASAFLFPIVIVVLYIAAFRGPLTNRIAANPLLTVIGGMCYSIYLLHLQVISFFAPHLQNYVFSSFILTALVQVMLISVAVVPVCSLFFMLVEKPCMDRNWPSKLLLWVLSMRQQIRRLVFRTHAETVPINGD